MPRSIALNQFFVYLRDQAASAARARQGSADPDKGGGVPNPIVTNTIMRDVFVMRDSIRMTDNG